jgi:hypothetical protein
MGRTLHEVLRIREARDHRTGRAIDLVGSAEPWHRLGFQDRRSTTGTADTRTVGSRLWRTASPDRSGSGTRSPMRSGRRSSTWPLMSRICRRANWPSTSPTRRPALCRNSNLCISKLVLVNFIVAQRAGRRSYLRVPAPVIREILWISNRFRVCPCTMLFSIPCMLPTAGAKISTPVDSTNCMRRSA